MPALQRPSDPSIACLVDLANREFRARRFKSAAAVARLGRARAPDEPAVQRLLSHAGPSLRRTPSDQPQDAAFHAALGTAHLRLGEPEAASREFRTALSLNGDLAEAHIGLSHLRMPGEGYYAWLDRLHAALRPDAYVEIGINKGGSLALARPPTLAIGVDPTPNIAVQFRTETMVYPETSDEFFQRRRLEGLLKGQPLRFAFIDGLHLFEQALRDFINLETYCGPRSVVCSTIVPVRRGNAKSGAADAVPHRRHLEGRSLPEGIPARSRCLYDRHAMVGPYGRHRARGRFRSARRCLRRGSRPFCRDAFLGYRTGCRSRFSMSYPMIGKRSPRVCGSGAFSDLSSIQIKRAPVHLCDDSTCAALIRLYGMSAALHPAELSSPF